MCTTFSKNSKNKYILPFSFKYRANNVKKILKYNHSEPYLVKGIFFTKPTESKNNKSLISTLVKTIFNQN